MNDDVTQIISTIFPQFDIADVTEIELEYLHEDIENYLNDKTAMDAIVRFLDSQSNPCFIAIETKYTDVLGSNSARNKEYQKKLIKPITKNGIRQMVAKFVLLLVEIKKNLKR